SFRRHAEPGLRADRRPRHARPAAAARREDRRAPGAPARALRRRLPMISTPIRRERWYTQIAPLATVFGAVLLNLLWIPVPGFNAMAPAFSVMPVYCWAIWRPQFLPYMGVFAAGLFEDLIRGTPLGTGALALVAAQGFVWAQQRLLRTRSFEVLWLGFAV